MRDKDSRLEAIKLVLSAQDISSQGELLRELRRMGFKLTQGTLSRDLKRLKAGKAMNASGRYVYVAAAQPPRRRAADSALSVPAAGRAGVLSVKFSGNLAVVHTLPGHASHIAYDIDCKRFEEILGTLAGDDTVLVVLSEGVSSASALRRLAEAVGDL